MLLSRSEKLLIKNYLALAPDPDQALSYDELCGFLFGLAITPEPIPPGEWLTVIFGGTPPRETAKTAKMAAGLIAICARFTADFQRENLFFPFDIGEMNDKKMEQLYEWVSGFEEAVALREEVWDPEEYPDLAERQREELYHAMLTIQGLVDPSEVIEFFDTLPDDLFQEAFPDIAPPFDDRETRIQMLLLASLPLTIATLMAHSRGVAEKPPPSLRLMPSRSPRHSATPEAEPPPGSCAGGCCGAKAESPVKKKKATLINVDFQQKKRAAQTWTFFQLKAELVGTDPPVWRRFTVPAQTSLFLLQHIIQISFGWQSTPEHHFFIGQTVYRPAAALPAKPKTSELDESQFCLGDLKDYLRPSFTYLLEGKKAWHCLLEVEDLFSAAVHCPAEVIGGGCAAPPDKIHDSAEYNRLLHAFAAPEDPGHRRARRMLGESFDAESFGIREIAAINERLRHLRD
jgi:yecA family protein